MTVLDTTGPVLDRTSSLVLTPAVVAHRGASGHRPEHTLDAYRTAIRMGVDDIELDLVITRDGVLVARHESEISRTTDVADHPELAHLRTTRTIDGVGTTGWFVEDLTLAQLKTLTARERMPGTRPANTAWDGAEGVPTLHRGAGHGRRRVRAPRAHRRGDGRAQARGVLRVRRAAAGPAAAGRPGPARPRPPVGARHADVLRDDRPAPAGRSHPAARRAAPGPRPPRPADLAAAGDPTTYGDLVTPEGLARIDDYADGIGAHKELVLPRDADGAIGEPSSLVRDAHRAWLTVHVWTLRAENRFLPTNLRSGDPRRARRHGRRGAGPARRGGGRDHHRPPRGGAAGRPRAAPAGCHRTRHLTFTPRSRPGRPRSVGSST